MKGKAVLAYSGGLDTSVAIEWIREKYGLDVVTLTLDVGQGVELKEVEEKAKKLRVSRHHSIDAKKEFVDDYVLPAIRANALYQGKYPLHSALSRPLIAKKLVDVARKENASAVAHGCTGKGNDQVRFEVTIKALAPELKVIAPIREWNLSRDSEVKYAMERGIPLTPSGGRPYSIDQNLWGRSIECGPLDDPYQEPPDEVFEWTVSPEEAPEKPEYVTVDFDEGTPTALNGVEFSPVELIAKLNGVAGRHGVGRVDHLEDRLVGLKSREVYESPSATVLIESHRDLEKAVLTRHELHFKQAVDAEWATLTYTGLWADPLRDALDAFITKTQERVTGKVRGKLFKGGFHIVGRSSPYSLYEPTLSTYEGKTEFDQSWSIGFIELWGLPTRLANLVKKKAQGRK